jgi:tetrapyrrole methylase family protein/MazG family protein
MPTPDAGQRFLDLLSVMKRLRGEGGCPWDREQTRESLRPYLVEEAYEVLEAIEAAQPEALREELGDLLFQVVFHAQIAEERGEFSMADLLAALAAKMTRRHPHVFGDRTVGSAAEALSQWESIKQAESAGRRSVLHGGPRRLPGLLAAQHVQQRASRVGFDWSEPGAALAKVREEADEVEEALRAGDQAAVRRELGDLLFAAVNVARLAATDPELALQQAVERFRRRFERMEQAADAAGRDIRAMSLDELEGLWGQAKRGERER